MSDPSSDQAARSGRIAGRYELGEPIGRGGRAVVHEGTDPLLQREVAVKLFHADSSIPPTVRVQEAEARVVAGLNHYALTTLFDAGVDATEPGRAAHLPGDGAHPGHRSAPAACASAVR